MIKNLDLAGFWHFAMDAAKDGIQNKQYLTMPEDTIPLPGTTSHAKKGFLPMKEKQVRLPILGFLKDMHGTVKIFL